MRKTFSSFDLIVICSLLWQALKAFAKVTAISAIFAAIVWFFVEAIVNA
jgi:hypothetical protein